ncbi:hypothetical protein CTA1_6428 [Colletotrichum tanaceti]|uniref:Post-SET domain-containing protein n=1 Tax=Colletotrichum tanaceti TaxID=1306861 RepID=A0A4U6X0I6_9PEZI|nr:hypothetical protein CTA1_6428 [Colletotrichum tanaceti]
MAQPFDCFCGAPSCRGTIAGARDMSRAQLEGLWLNGHIRELLEDRDAGIPSGNDSDPTAQALRDALKAAEHVVEAARSALRSYTEAAGRSNCQQQQTTKNGINGTNGTKARGLLSSASREQPGAVGAGRNGASARELGGEMGGDTRAA